jgi:hypothetical protein
MPRTGTAGKESPRVPMLRTFHLDEYVFDALRAGASGFCVDLEHTYAVDGSRSMGVC